MTHLKICGKVLGVFFLENRCNLALNYPTTMTEKFYRQVHSKWKMALYLFWKLPGAWFMGARVASCHAEACVTTLRYGWRSQNPFHSTYFAAQCAAGELSTGLLAMTHLQGKPPVSMLVTHFEADYFIKVNQTLQFTCAQGADFAETIAQTLATGEAQTLEALSIGTLPDGKVATHVRVTWSFKRKKSA